MPVQYLIKQRLLPMPVQHLIKQRLLPMPVQYPRTMPIWNLLPPQVQSAPGANHFKSLLKNIILIKVGACMCAHLNSPVAMVRAVRQDKTNCYQLSINLRQDSYPKTLQGLPKHNRTTHPTCIKEELVALT